MAGNQMVQICRRHERSFLRSLKEAKGLREKHVHRLRLDVKNLRVLLLLQDTLSGKKKTSKKMQSLVTPLFNHAGHMRSAVLNLSLTQGFNGPVVKKFRRELRQRRQLSAQQLREAIDRFSDRKFLRLNSRVADAFRERKNKKIRKDATDYLRSLFAQVRAELFDLSDDETLHEVRKKLKVIKNLGALLTELDDSHPFTDELTRINSTYEKIGQWHDVAVLLDELQGYLKALNDPSAALKAAPMLRQLRQQCTRSKQRVEKKLKADLVW
jgi:hypothetical protein